MHISKLSLVNYRNFANTKLLFQKGINTIIGENGSGKTNLFRAIRLLLDDNMIRSAKRLESTDFHRGLGRWQGHWIIISLEFEDISADEAAQALFLHGSAVIDNKPIGKATYNLIFRPNKEIRLRLSELEGGDHDGLDDILNHVTVDDYETIFTGRSSADFNDEDFYKNVVGDFEHAIFNEEIEFPSIGAKVPTMLSLSKEISFTFIKALRDVIAEFHSNRTNPLLSLLKAKSGDINQHAFQNITDSMKGLNESIENLEDVQRVRADIKDTIKEAAGETYSPTSLSIKSDLPDEADKLFQSLKLFIGESEENYDGPIHELSLGGANLIFLTLKLLEFNYQKAKQSIANFLLIEEPEAHIHTHIQKTLFDRIQYEDTQIIYSTHSTQISEVSNIQNVNILGREYNRCVAYQPTTGLDSEQIGNIQRYLDAVRSNLLFAKNVILVEGDTEEILVPILVKKVLGISLDELGISLINIRSTGFKNVAVLFHDDRIRKRCSIITDLDKSIIDTDAETEDSAQERLRKEHYLNSQKSGLQRKTALENSFKNNPWVKAFFADYTFEVDFVKAGNANIVVEILSNIYRRTTTRRAAKAELESSIIASYGERVLSMANKHGKGWFAILLGSKIDQQTVIPSYILEAIAFALPEVKRELWFNVLSYRLHHIIDAEICRVPAVINGFYNRLEAYGKGDIEFDDIRREMKDTFPGDRINDFLELF